MENRQKEKVWFITGSSRGFGKYGQKPL